MRTMTQEEFITLVEKEMNADRRLWFSMKSGCCGYPEVKVDIVECNGYIIIGYTEKEEGK